MLMGVRRETIALSLGQPPTPATPARTAEAQTIVLRAIQAREGRQTSTLLWTVGAMAVIAGLGWAFSEDYRKTPAWAVGGLGAAAVAVAALVGWRYDQRMIRALLEEFEKQGVDPTLLPEA